MKELLMQHQQGLAAADQRPDSKRHRSLITILNKSDKQIHTYIHISKREQREEG